MEMSDVTKHHWPKKKGWQNFAGPFPPRWCGQSTALLLSLIANSMKKKIILHNKQGAIFK
jgi:hypothetical protein